MMKGPSPRHPHPAPPLRGFLSQDQVCVSRFFLISLFCPMVKLSLHTALSYWSPLGTCCLAA